MKPNMESAREHKFQHNPNWRNSKISWVNSSFIVITPLLMVALMPYVIYTSGLAWVDFWIYSFMIFTTGVSLTVGYHRLFAHQTFDTPNWVRALLLFFGAGCIENSALKWSSDHRYHHRFVDKEGDPYHINKGFFYAHMGWIFFQLTRYATATQGPRLVRHALLLLLLAFALFSCVHEIFYQRIFWLALGAMLARPFSAKAAPATGQINEIK